MQVLQKVEKLFPCSCQKASKPQVSLQVLQTWFTIFLLFMTLLLLLLNMLLAVILIQYSLVKEQATITDNNPIWTQARNFFKRKLETHGHAMSLQRIQRILDGKSKYEDFGAGVVTRASLIEAFPSMTTEQALWVENTFAAELHKEKFHHRDIEDKNNRHTRNECLLRSVAHKVHELPAVTHQNMMKLSKAQAFLHDEFTDVSKKGIEPQIMIPYNKTKELPAVQYSFDR